MKKFLALCLIGVMLMCLTACGEQPSYETINNDVVDVTATDAFGEHSIVIISDSMGHGATSVDIPNNSWVGLLKQRVNAITGDNNYGFTSVEGTLWGATQSHEIHKFPTTPEGFKDPGKKGDGWTEYRTAELLGTKGLGSSKKGATLTFAPKETFAYFTVYYQAGPDYGTFDVKNADGEVLCSVDCADGVEAANFARTEMLDMTKLGTKNEIVLEATSNDEVIFTGIGYYNTPDGVVVSNYANGGLQLAGTGKDSQGNTTGLDTKFLDLAATSGTLIFSLGYNDAYFTSDLELFSEKIDYLIAAVNESGTKVIVSDTCWSKNAPPAKKMRVNTVKTELKRLAEETGGIYVDQEEVCGDALYKSVKGNDNVHPDAEGHALIAQAIIEAMQLQEETAE